VGFQGRLRVGLELWVANKRWCHVPRKLSRILAAFSASPGNVKPWTNACELVWTRLEPSFMNAVAWMPAFCAPCRNLFSIDIVVVIGRVLQ
jgi:hypothetical protein